MKLKSKMIASIMSICLLCAVFAIGVFALKTANLKIGGDVSFSATGVEADIKNVTLTGATNNDQVLATGSINTSMTQVDIDTKFQNWQSLKLDFDENATDIELKFDIANTSTNADNYIEIDYSYTFNNPNPNVDVFPGDENGEGVWENNNYILTPKGANPADTEYETFVLKFSILDKELNVPADTSVSLNINLKHITPFLSATGHSTEGMPEGETCWLGAGASIVNQQSFNGTFEIPAVINDGSNNYIVTKISSEDGVPYFYSVDKLTTLIIPNSIRNIEGLSVFDSTPNLSYVKFPNSLISICGEEESGCAFQSTAITSLCLPNSLQIIGENAFTSCPILEVKIPTSVIMIGEYAFSGCSFSSISVPTNVVAIGTGAFGEGHLRYARFDNPVGWYFSSDFNSLSGEDIMVSAEYSEENATILMNIIPEEYETSMWLLRK